MKKQECTHRLEVVEVYDSEKSKFFFKVKRRIYVMQCKFCGEIGKRFIDLPFHSEKDEDAVE